jgi:uncharacterized protein
MHESRLARRIVHEHVFGMTRTHSVRSFVVWFLVLFAQACASPRPSPAPVTWFSLPARDVEKAAVFYERVFGWHAAPLTQEPDHAYDYKVLVNSPSDASFTPREAGRVNGCLVKREIGVSTPVMLIEVADLDAAAKAVVAAGGTVVTAKVPMSSLDGEFVLVKDPEGNMLELFQASRR